ncbi:MAG TPA: polyprenol phosphomannose-dependent alpha 1,6 mannosyltransferase MptB [Acidimicrobiales bacterium]|nr:polyprenol phosphomannose-dependent alpha 1,6 mannosyltransferase MptB [Acidimicrobiales bacterium]
MGSPMAVQGAQNIPARRSLPALTPWIALGFFGSVGLAVTGTSVGSVTEPNHALWWFSIPNGQSVLVTALFYVSVALLIVGWLGVGNQARKGLLTVKWAWLILLVWGVPLFLAPPLFSRDLYSYIGQGLLAHHGLNPYSVAPKALGHGPLLSSIASVWRGTASPYGPLFVGAANVVAGAAGSSLVSQVLAFRVLELVGVVLIMVSLPRLARHLGTDPGIALWLGALSPLALFSFIGSGHNDALMMGLLVAGVALAVEGRLAWGMALCALAATVKLPAAAAIVFLAVDQFQAASGTRRWRVLAEVVIVPVVVLAAVTLVVGLGWTWLGPSALHVPTELKVLSTPAVALGVFFAHLLHAIDIPVRQATMITIAQVVCGAGAVLSCIWLVINAHKLDVIRALGLALLLIVVGGPTVWPWYLMWGLTFLAATTTQRSKLLAAVAALAMLVVGPSGHPLLNGNVYLVVALVTLGACVWLARNRHWYQVASGHAS